MDCCEHCNEHSGSIDGGKFSYHLSDYQLLICAVGYLVISYLEYKYWANFEEKSNRGINKNIEDKWINFDISSTDNLP
jgi:hypothetical protein